MSLLASRGIDFNFANENEGLTPLMRAVRSRERFRFETIAFLIDQGVDLNATSLHGLSARDQLMKEHGHEKRRRGGRLFSFGAT